MLDSFSKSQQLGIGLIFWPVKESSQWVGGMRKRARRTFRRYIVKSEHSIGEVFAAIKNGRYKFMSASLKSLRIQNFFVHGISCVNCGRTGTIFKVERVRLSKHHKYARWHLNLYHVKKTGAEVMMTADHIIPRSRGGRTTLENLQPMCAPCNERKGSLLPGESQAVNKEIKRKVIDWNKLFSVSWIWRAIRFLVYNLKLPSLPKKRKG